MNVLPFEYFVNSNTFNIFTDASIIHRKISYSGETYVYYFGSSGAEIYEGDKMISTYHTVLPHCTNNQSEITAIEYAIHRGCQFASLNNIENINIFSDSKICIYGIREWVFNWIKNMNDGILYNTSGKVSNQSHFISIIQSVLYYNRPIRFYHIRGHFNSNSFKERKKFNESFMRENYISVPLDERLINFFIKANDSVDTITRNELKNIQESTFVYYDNVAKKMLQYPRKEPIFNWDERIRSLDLNKYKQLIGGI